MYEQVYLTPAGWLVGRGEVGGSLINSTCFPYPYFIPNEKEVARHNIFRGIITINGNK